MPGWDGIEPARIPRVTAADAACREPAAFCRAVCAQRLQRVVRAARIEAARRCHQGADGNLIEPQQEGKQGFHGAGRAFAWIAAWAANRRVSSTRSSAFSFAVVAGPALVLTDFDSRTTQSMAGRPVTRNSSRVTRLMVLRVTARGARRLATTTPSRAWGS